MKSLKKELITIIVLLVVAVIGTYAVNASTQENPVKKQAIAQKMTIPSVKLVEKSKAEAGVMLAEGGYCGCVQPSGNEDDPLAAWQTYAACLEGCINSH